MSENNKPMAPYAKLPELEEYKEWFKDFADLTVKMVSFR